MLFSKKTSVLLIYTGGTIGSVKNPVTGALQPFNFNQLLSQVPELSGFNYIISSYQFDPPIDSSDIDPSYWSRLVSIIKYNYDSYDGFVILHGTDTMAYTASALSFMLENLTKPVVLTGSQLPIGELRTDGKENLITSIEIAAAKDDEGNAMVPEVCIYFDNHLLRGNRTTKLSAEHFNAFRSFNYPELAVAGIRIDYHKDFIYKPVRKGPLEIHKNLDTNMLVFTIFPGISQETVEKILHGTSAKGIVMRTFGSGNAPRKPWLLKELRDAVDRGMTIVNISQCPIGVVQMSQYETGIHLLECGVISGHDATLETAIVKMMYLLGRGYSQREIRFKMNTSLRGEITI